MPSYKTEKGKWYCKFYVKDFLGNRKQILRRGFRTKRDAQAYENDFKAKYTSNPSMSLRTLSDEFLEDYRINHRASSYRLIESVLRVHILPSLGEFSVCDISPRILREWMNGVKEKELAFTSQNNILSVLKRLLRYGVKYYHLPSDILPTETLGKKERRLSFLELSDWNKLFAVIQDKHDRAVYSLLFWCGMRIAEVMGLTEDDIDFAEHTISINKQYEYHAGEITPPKTVLSRRTVVAPATVMNIVREYFDSYHTVPDLPFAVMSQSQIYRRLIHYCKEADVPRTNLHALRHSHASLLIRQGVPVNAISSRLGHSNTSITMNVYGHVYKDADSEIAVNLDKLVSK